MRRMHSTIATQHGGGVPKGNYLTRMQSALARTEAQGQTVSQATKTEISTQKRASAPAAQTATGKNKPRG